jgi:hypothetical protein
MKTPKSLSFPCLALTLALLSNATIRAVDNQNPANPTGTWKWIFSTQNGQAIESSLKLKLEGDKLTGTYIGRGGSETAIQDAKLKDDQLSFTVVRERNGQTMTSKYSGKLAGDTIKGKVETERDGQTRTRDWEAKREMAAASGTWKWTFDIPNGQTLEPVAKLTQQGDKLTGVLVIGDRERPISEGTINGTDISFKVVSKRDDDRTVTSKYYGKLNGDHIKGKWDSDWSGDVVTRDWDAKRSKE